MVLPAFAALHYVKLGGSGCSACASLQQPLIVTSSQSFHSLPHLPPTNSRNRASYGLTVAAPPLRYPAGTHFSGSIVMTDRFPAIFQHKIRAIFQHEIPSKHVTRCAVSGAAALSTARQQTCRCCCFHVPSSTHVMPSIASGCRRGDDDGSKLRGHAVWHDIGPSRGGR